MIRRHHIALLVALVGCKSSAEKLCQRAADRYEQCVGEKLGADLKKMVHDKAAAGVAACAADDKTVAMYQECIDKPSCDAFDDCMTAYAERTMPESMRAEARSQHAADDVDGTKPAKAMGPPGPAIAWRWRVAEGFGDQPLVWAADQVLVAGDDNGLSAVKGGKELWHVGAAHDVVAIGSRLALATDQGLRIVDAATGEEIATPVTGSVFRLSANRGHVTFVQHDETVFDVDVEHCSAKHCQPRTIATLSDDMITARADALPSGTLVTGASAVRVLDAAGKLRVSLDLSEEHDSRATLAGRQLAIKDDTGVALLSLAACAKLGSKLYLPSTAPPGDDAPRDGAKIVVAPCFVAQLSVDFPQGVTAAPSGGVALNSAGDNPQTHFLSDTKVWAVPAGGVGDVAIAGDSIYTLAKDSDDHVGVVALSLGSGERQWATMLPGASTTGAQVAVHDGYLAARAGSDVFVLALPAAGKPAAPSH